MSEYGPMYDAIMAASPIGYWPLTNVTDVVASVAGELISAPTFTGRSLNDDVRPSLLTSAQYGGIRISHDQYPSIISAEVCFIIGGSSSYTRAIVGFQQSTTQLSGRFFIATIPGNGNALTVYAQNNAITVLSDTYASLSDKPHHVYIEYISELDTTAIYIDGVSAYTCAGNQLAATVTGRYITAGGYYSGSNMWGGGSVSDLALYSRRLTAAEIAARVALVGDPTPIHQTTVSPALWGNEQSPAELASPDPFFASAAPVQGGIRWLTGAITTPPQRDDYGYIEGAITRRGDVAPAHIVACFDSGFNLIDTATSGIAGEYRFDNLPLQDSYMIVAMDNATYTYNPAAADRRTPRAYS